ncbi:hypothetical protein E2C01_014361 [Portunus trituberculatus]|uniref:Uncharacterized protein n=1 Tax=Portunus trituberculatus TaxID=210409 RepID=A0A5B7DJX8_PORTR|nr:hypothetical protein [Portunus trituberculatus]
MVLGEQGLHIKRLAHLPHTDSNPGPLSCEPSVVTTTIHGLARHISQYNTAPLHSTTLHSNVL